LTTNNKDGYAINERDLTITDIKNLDLSKIDVACLVNLTKWKNIEDKTDKESKTYLSFVKGNKEVSKYFMSFIDCQDKTTNAESTKKLIQTIDKYCSKKGYDRDTTIKKKNSIFDYCIDCLKDKKEISLSAISVLLDIEEPDEFAEFASNEENGVSPTISGDRSQLRKIKYVFYKDKDITVGFDNGLLNKTVFYDPQKKQLTFKKLPAELIMELDKETKK
jgi:nucleoid-associated protein YejK